MISRLFAVLFNMCEVEVRDNLYYDLNIVVGSQLHAFLVTSIQEHEAKAVIEGWRYYFVEGDHMSLELGPNNEIIFMPSCGPAYYIVLS